MESRNGSFAAGMVTGSPELTRRAMVSQAQAGGLLTGEQNGQSADTFSAGSYNSAFLSQSLKGGY